ncbi:hypothetical protein [Spiroplasma melliferum]|uniref:hypothetical protein n=1 Tax=Spiroplasma melliferum TaxID=2134 RepID=UPI000C7823C9|nr:hypothetical protein [Spiroplasma melliferum]
MGKALFVPDLNEINCIKLIPSISFNKIKWDSKHLKLFEYFEKIDEDILIQIFDVYFNDKNKIIAMSFKITPRMSLNYILSSIIHFDLEGTIENNLNNDLENIVAEQPQANEKIVKKFYKTLINYQNEQNINKN